MRLTVSVAGALARIALKIAGAAVLGSIWLGAPSSLIAQDARKVVQTASPSVVLLIMQDGQGQPIALGSGFFVSSNVIATNLHVVEGAAKGQARVVGQKISYGVEGMVGVDEGRDLALLRLTEAKGSPLQIGDSGKVMVGDPIYVVGSPQGLEGTLSEGIISAIRPVGSDKLLQITAPISPGSSGGPVLDSGARVIGVAAATLKGGQNLNFAIPSAYLSELLAHMKSLTPLAPSSLSASRSSVAKLGSKPTEGVVVEHFSWEPPCYMDTFSGKARMDRFSGDFTFSIVNKLAEPVTNVYGLLIFYAPNDEPVDSYEVRFAGPIPAGLAKRTGGSVIESVGRFVKWEGCQTDVRFRVLDFDASGSSSQ